MAKTNKNEDNGIGQTWLLPLERGRAINKDIEKMKDLAFEKMGKESLNDCMQVFNEKNFWDEGLGFLRPYVVGDDGVLTIPIDGTLMGGAVSIRLAGMLTGHDYIKQAVKRGMADEKVRAIAFNINSPGGSVLGNFELADFLEKQRGKKPMMSFVEGLCCSGAYSIAAAIGPIAMSVGSEAGSVGVYTMHVDESERLKKAGVKVKFISAGATKTDGNPYEELKTDAEKSIKERIDGLYSNFVLRVAKFRGISEEAVIELGARVFNADKSIEVGFADKTGDLDEIRAEFIENLTTKKKEEKMTKPAEDTIATEDHKEKVETARTEAKAEGVEAGKKAMQERYAAVMGSDEYAGREKQAQDMLASEDFAAVPTEALIKILGSGAKESVETTDADADNGGGDGSHGLSEVMKTEKAPKVSANKTEEHETGGDASDQAVIDELVALAE